jgi:glycosyltransferase involved in cell wall biosynthesis
MTSLTTIERVGQEITDHGVETPMKIWPRGIDTTNFNVNFRSDKVRKDWGLKPGEVAVLFASRMVWEKNVRVYIDTMNYMIEQKYPIRSVSHNS